VVHGIGDVGVRAIDPILDVGLDAPRELVVADLPS
jgi:hypothetical protein